MITLKMQDLDENSQITLLAKVVELDNDQFPQPWSALDWASTLSQERYHLFLSMKGETLVGFCLFDLLPGDTGGHLLKILVDVKERGSGLAQKVFLTSASSLSEKGLLSVYLEVSDFNKRALLFYHSMGFSKVSVKRNFYAKGEDAVVMVRNL